MKMHIKMFSAKWQPFCPGGYELNLLAEAASGVNGLSVIIRFGGETGGGLLGCEPFIIIKAVCLEICCCHLTRGG